ncbi:transcription initiation factor IID, TAF10 subunit [Aulographum hederae CBS 113979]|uniref:Transcription initiation factor IID, TAF10 subunit n=1 Tax=Aulographum hederae CBS 113979 TaxID=1176131 RepID=A0A6G1GIZ1_9PEZI|nr:transcription initiation factor IID, TAF10 subunit [Aulographum hederae CBS 113979]
MADLNQPPTSTSHPTNPLSVPDAPLDADIERDLDTELQPDASADTMNTDGSGDAAGGGAGAGGIVGSGEDEAIPEPRIPAKKDASLREFLGKMDEYAPIIPDAVTSYYLTLSGLPPPPQTSPHLTRLLALATQKFIADIATDAYQYSRIRSNNTSSNNPLGGLNLGVAGGPGAAGAAGAAGGAGGAGAGGAGGGGGGAGGKEAAKNANLGVQRPGFGGGGQGGNQGKTVLTMEDLGMAVGEYGVNVKRNEFYR